MYTCVKHLLKRLWLCQYICISRIATDKEQEDDEEKKTLEGIRDCTSKVGISGVETTAYLRALGAQKGLDLDKFRGQVQDELAANSKKTKKGNYCCNLDFWNVFNTN